MDLKNAWIVVDKNGKWCSNLSGAMRLRTEVRQSVERRYKEIYGKELNWANIKKKLSLRFEKVIIADGGYFWNLDSAIRADVIEEEDFGDNRLINRVF